MAHRIFDLKHCADLKLGLEVWSEEGATFISKRSRACMLRFYFNLLLLGKGTF